MEVTKAMGEAKKLFDDGKAKAPDDPEFTKAINRFDDEATYCTYLLVDKATSLKPVPTQLEDAMLLCSQKAIQKLPIQIRSCEAPVGSLGT